MSSAPKTDAPTPHDLLDLSGVDALTAFFDRLGYAPDRLEQIPENLGITAESTRRPIRRIERIARHGDPLLPQIEVYLFELSKVTLTHTRALVKAFRDRVGFFLLVLTSDWERLDFVYVERQVPEAGRGSPTSPRGPERVRLRPRILTVHRRNPHRVGLRVLRRLRWTEADSLAQDQKILAAYSVADWSEELFNNRALFSDHYLNRSFPEKSPWGEDPKPAMRELARIFHDAESRFAAGKLAEARAGLFGPALRALGFRFSAGGGESPPPPTKPDDDGLRLYAPHGTPVATFLDCPWERYLDGKDDQDAERPDDNPGIRVVRALEGPRGEETVDWVVLTNGRLWRLYARRAHSRATNYYEIDLPELLTPGDPDQALTAFRYFWLLFRRAAFERRPSRREGREVREALVDQVLQESQEYAKDLGERLKDVVFDEVFPELSRGFLESLARGEELYSQPELDAAFRATLAFLYRTLFVLYAEARNLLPIHEVHDYLEISLKRIREEIKDAGGAALTSRDQRLAKRYRKDSFALYDRLQRLFRVIDLGDSAVNVPTYNGGLFLSDPDDSDSGAEAEAARFLSRARVDDLTLARALDRLARSEEVKRAELVFIDYRSLGVRQLGSIYEGLLEFRLRVAREQMAVVAEKKGSGRTSERVVPLRVARTSRKLKVLLTGRGKDAAERLLAPGDVYLENDKGERRLTGSYYTPDFVVEYLVARTLSPILEEKLDALRPRVRQAQQWQRRMARMAEQKGEPAQKYLAGPAVDGEWRHLVADFFDVKVLDPAMGSGHFLVEAVDFITDKMLEFLAAFPWNPIFAYLESARREIVAEMEKLEIMIPEERLTDVNLLKRHVLKRCIYGVDLNPMAVELAKVSLWLDCFTLGAPLSFLDHHLRCGNSLLGVTIDEVREEIEGTGGEDRSQLTLFTTRFAALKLATAAMAAVGAMPDVTSEQVNSSRQAYRDATNALAPYHRMLDVWCSRWFLEPPSVVKPNGPVAVEKKKKPVKDRVVEYLKAESVEPYLDAGTESEAATALARLEDVDREYLAAVAELARERSFFHWEIEFPEVFYRQRPGTERQMERAHGEEFDAVMGNPPWVRQESLKDLKPALRESFQETFAAEADIYVFLVARALEVLAYGGRFGMILQNKWFKTEYAARFREYLRDKMQPLEVVDFGHAPLFTDADTFPCTLLVLKPVEDASEYREVDFIKVNREDLPGIDLTQYGAQTRMAVPRSRLRRTGWELAETSVGNLIQKIRGAGVRLRDLVESPPLYGLKTGLNEAFLISQTTRDRLVEEDPACENLIRPFLRGESTRRWHSPWGGEWMILLKSSQNYEWPWSSAGSVAEAGDIFRVELPSIYGWLAGYKDRLQNRKDQGRFWWELRSCDYYDKFSEPKIMYQDIAFHSGFALDESSLYCNNTCYFTPTGDYIVLAALNSSVAWYVFDSLMQKAKDGAFRLHSIYMADFPVPVVEQPLREVVERGAQEIAELSASFRQTEGIYESLAGIGNKRSKKSQAWKLPAEIFKERFRRHAESERLIETRNVLRRLRQEICLFEVKIQSQVFDLYELTSDDVLVLRKTAPPRDPLTLAEEDLRLLSDD